MADGYARVSGQPGVAFVITGPGVTNALTAMAQSREDSVPVLVISGVNRARRWARAWACCTNCPIRRRWCAPCARRVRSPMPAEVGAHAGLGL